MKQTEIMLGLDIGDKRIGVARGNTTARLAAPLTIVPVDGNEQSTISRLIEEENARRLIVGLPRNLDGEETQQTAAVRKYVDEVVADLGLPITWQDEAGSSVSARTRQDKRTKFSNDDAHAAAIILQDYLDNL